MPYSAEISRANPTCFVFLIDQSRSMSGPFGSASATNKSQGVADAINRLLAALVDRCAKGETVLDRYFVGVIGYGKEVGPALGGTLATQPLVAISDVAQHPLHIDERTKKVSDGAGGLVDERIRFPVWIEAQADGRTPMCKAFGLAWRIIDEFLGRFPASFPPIVINISDGQATDGLPGDVESGAQRIRNLSSNDGNVLLLNMHLSSNDSTPVQFPNDEQSLPDDHARLLFRISSTLPAPMVDVARREGFTVTEDSRGFVFNADLVSVVQFLDIGTRVDRTVRVVK